VGACRTTRCCSAVALVVAVAIPTNTTTTAAQTTRSSDLISLSLFPIRVVWTLALSNQLIAPPAYSQSHAFFAIEGDRLVAYELEGGKQEWIASAKPDFEPAVGDGLVFLAQRQSLTALRIEGGAVAWERPDIGELSAPPVWDNGWLVAVTDGGEVLTFRAIDGHLVWRRDLGSSAYAPPSLAADRVYIPLEDGRVVALRVDTGEVVWERRLGGPATGLVADSDSLYAGSIDNFLYALDASDGAVRWRWRTGADVVGVPVIDQRNVYFVSLDNVLRALSRKSGVQQWVKPLPLRPTRGPLQVGSALLVSGVTPPLRAFTMKDGAAAGEVPGSGELAGAPYARQESSQILTVTRDLAKGATVTLFMRRLDPPLSNEPLPNASRAVFLDPVIDPEP
jgi:hypothetical protein